MRLEILGKYRDKLVEIDEEDYHRLSNYKWWICNKNGYLCVYTQVNKKTIYLSRFILNYNGPQIVDHIDRNPLNNKKENLRFATAQQNAWNASIKSNNISGFPGVDFRPDRQKWRATIRIDGIKKSLGHFDTLEEAVVVRKNKEQELRDNWCPKYK